MSVRTGVRELVPDVEERQRARTWLLPWADHAGWWRAPVGVVGVLGVIRALLLVVSHRPWFMNDSAEYLLLVDDLYVPRTRPPGVSVFWRADLVLWHSLDSILVAQALLGIGAGLLLFLAAREIGLGTRPAVVVAVLASCAPTVLFFERVLLTESLSYFFAVLTMWLMLVLASSFHLRRRIGQRQWRLLHYASSIAFTLGLYHALNVGSDFTGARGLLFVGIAAAPVLWLAYARILMPRAKPRPAPPRPPLPSAQPPLDDPSAPRAAVTA